MVPSYYSGTGSGHGFAPIANVVLSAVSSPDDSKVPGVNNAIRQLGGVFGAAIIAPVSFADGL